MSVSEKRYQVISGVWGEGGAVQEVAAQWKVDRRTVHRWLARYEAEGLEGLTEGSHRPEHCPHQMASEVEALVLEVRRAPRYWGARRVAVGRERRGVKPAPAGSAVYRGPGRAAGLEPRQRDPRQAAW